MLIRIVCNPSSRIGHLIIKAVPFCQWLTRQPQPCIDFQFPYVDCMFSHLWGVFFYKDLLKKSPSAKKNTNRVTERDAVCSLQWNLHNSPSCEHTHAHTHTQHCYCITDSGEMLDGRRDLFISVQQRPSLKFNENLWRDLRNYSDICTLLVDLYKEVWQTKTMEMSPLDRHWFSICAILAVVSLTLLQQQSHCLNCKLLTENTATIRPGQKFRQEAAVPWGDQININ